MTVYSMKKGEGSMNDAKTNKRKSNLTIKLIVIGIILFVFLVIFMSNTGEQELAAAAANARVPLGEVFKGLLSKYF